MTTLTREKAIKIANEFLKEKLKQEAWFKVVEPHIKACLLYGSTAKGTNRQDSDIDILIILPLEHEERYTKGEYLYTFKEHEINIVLRSIERLRKIAKEKNILTVQDNSYLGPANLKESFNQFDIILHSATKIICGQGDAMGGIVCLNHHLRKILFKDGLMSIGSVMTSQVAELLYERMQNYQQRTANIANEMKIFLKYLKNNKKIEKIYYPWDLTDSGDWTIHPHYHFPVGLLSFVLKTKDRKQVESFADNLKLVKKGVSYGSAEALIIPSILFLKEHETPPFPVGICRFSLGEQTASEVIADFEQALKISLI
jgi:methionine-gamma-lyase